MPGVTGAKAAGALLTIGEVARETGVAPHILRFWESRFTQLRPLQRAGGRRYYRPDDVALVRRIDALLGRQGYTIRGVQQLLLASEPGERGVPADQHATLRAIRAMLAAALADDQG